VKGRLVATLSTVSRASLTSSVLGQCVLHTLQRWYNSKSRKSYQPTRASRAPSSAVPSVVLYSQ
jgi:hypothetical protein